MKREREKRFLKSVLSVKDSMADENEFSEYLDKIVKGRQNKYYKDLINKYSKDLIVRAAEYFQNLSQADRRSLQLNNDIEGTVLSYMENNSDKLSLADLKRAISHGGKPKPPVKSHILDDVPFVQYDEDGNARPAPKLKVKKEAPKMPSDAEIEKMDSSEIKNLVSQLQDQE